MSPLLGQALRAGAAAVPRLSGVGGGHLMVAGAAGPLGSAVLERVLGDGHWPLVSTLVTQPLDVAMRGLRALQVHPMFGDDPALAGGPQSAIVVFDRERGLRGRNDREAAFLRPQAKSLPVLARWLHAAGVRSLVIVLPHAPALLPQALRRGLASLDEQAVAALGFEQLVIVRPSRLEPASDGGRPLLQRVAATLLAQLHWMVPQRDQPLRRERIAEFVVTLLRRLPGAAPGSRVAPPELLWDWAQPGGGDAVLQPWLQGGTWTPGPAGPAGRHGR